MPMKVNKSQTLLMAGMLASGTLGLATPASHAITLSTGSGDGHVTIDVNGFGAFGTLPLIGGDAGEANYNPVGPFEGKSTVKVSAVNLRRFNEPGVWLTSGSVVDSPGGLTAPDDFVVTETSGDRNTEATSSFNVFGLFSVSLTQQIFNKEELIAADIFPEDAATDALLTQTYQVTNLSDSAEDLELIRFIDGDMTFDGLVTGDNDGGLKTVTFVPEGQTILAQTDSPTGPSVDTTFIGVTADAGGPIDPLTGEAAPFEEPSENRFEIDQQGNVRSGIGAGDLLRDLVFGDENDDEAVDDGFTREGSDVEGYDVALGLASRVFIDPGSTITFVTHTVFGIGTPDNPVGTGPDDTPIGCLPSPLQDCTGFGDGGTDSTDMPTTDSTDMPTTDSTDMPTTDSTDMPTTDSTDMPTTTTDGMVVPEPVTVTMGLIGLSALGLSASRRRN